MSTRSLLAPLKIGFVALTLLASLPALGFDTMLAKQAEAELKSGKAVLVDVREGDELESKGTAKPACWLPTSAIKAKDAKVNAFVARLAKEKNKKVYVYCAIGGRAGQFVSALKKQGIEAINLGGLDTWQKASLPIRKVASAKNEQLCK